MELYRAADLTRGPSTVAFLDPVIYVFDKESVVEGDSSLLLPFLSLEFDIDEFTIGEVLLAVVG